METSTRLPTCRPAAVGVAALLLVAGCATPGLRKFPDRPPAWHEHDDVHLTRTPSPSRLADTPGAVFIREEITRPVDRRLALALPRAAEDVNSLDEVPCSTWYCPRNHLRRLDPAAVAAGPPAEAPRPPYRVVSAKVGGATPGFVVEDAAGRRFLLKLDVAGYEGLASGAEIVGTRLAWAAGYHVPPVFLVKVDPGAIALDPEAEVEINSSVSRRMRRDDVDAILAEAARGPDGRLRGVAVAWVPGEPLGAFSFSGTRKGDANDRIPHEHRRSLRAAYLLFAWINDADARTPNTLTSVVEEDGRRFVRHYLIDFGASLGSWTVRHKSPVLGYEHDVSPGPTLRALFSLGTFRRPWQDDLDRWARLNRRYPSLGYFEAEGWDAGGFQTTKRVPAFEEMTERDAYWGAKVITSFTDEQIRAAVEAADYPPDAEAYLVHALQVRRDLIGKEWLTRVTALEDPWVSAAGDRLCFRDLVVERGYARPDQVTYVVDARTAEGRRLARAGWQPRSARTCVPIRDGATGVARRGGDYRVVGVTAAIDGARAAQSRVHLAWRPAERRFVVVGIERDEHR